LTPGRVVFANVLRKLGFGLFCVIAVLAGWGYVKAASSATLPHARDQPTQRVAAATVVGRLPRAPGASLAVGHWSELARPQHAVARTPRP
jgi:hypothetical protein